MGPNAGLHGGGCAVQASFLWSAHDGHLVSSHYERTRDPQIGIRQGPHRQEPDMPACQPAGGRLAISVVARRTGTMKQQRSCA